MSTGFMETWLFDSLLVTTLLMAAILVIRRPVARVFGAGVAYALWLIPALRLLMPSIEGAATPAVSEAQWMRDAVRETVLSGVSSGNPAVSAVAEAPAAAVDWAAMGVTFWLGGAALFFIIQMIRYASMRDDLLSDAEEIATIDGVKLVASDQVAGPLAFGLFKRYVAVPLNFTKTYSPAERELAIAHEMAHHKSGDLFANLAAFIVLCLQWFNPVAWASWSAFRFDQEAACDARVLAGKGSEERVIYGQALARTAFDGVPTFATALNSPKTIMERLRRLSMKDASTKRRTFGKLGILAAGAVILPLTATVVPAVVAQEVEKAVEEAGKPEKIEKQVKVIKIVKKDGETAHITAHDGDGKEVTKIERDGKTFVFRTDKQLTEDEVEKMVAEAEKSAEEAEKMAGERKISAMRVKLDADEMKEMQKRIVIAQKDLAKAQSFHWDDKEFRKSMNIAAYIPEIDIKEIRKNCREGEPVTTDVRGFDGQHRSTIKLVMCGKGQAKIARASAIEGLRDARSDVSTDENIPENVRKDVVDKLDEQIRRLEAQVDEHS